MKLTIKQLALGFFPILLGFVPVFRILPLFLGNILFLVLWFWLCFRLTDADQPIALQFLRICLPGTVIVILGLCQELIPNNNLPGIIITASNFYFLSGINLAGRIITPFLRVITAWPYYIVSWFVLTFGALFTVILKKKVA